MSDPLSPLDARYARRVDALREWGSAKVITQLRYDVEVAYLIDLLALLKRDPPPALPGRLTDEHHARIAEIERRTNHDVKALTSFIEEELRRAGASDDTVAMVHFGLTSQDVCSVASSISIQQMAQVLETAFETLFEELLGLADRGGGAPILSLTHGQPATPKEWVRVIGFHLVRLRTTSVELNRRIGELTAKFGGATGDFTAHRLVCPEIGWEAFGREFVGHWSLTRTECTTQIDDYSSYIRLFQTLLLGIRQLYDLVDLLWNYIKDETLTQAVVATETGSSTMPQKVNPIDFENSMAHISLATAQLEGMIRDLGCSRYQRDLKDSAMLRYVPELFGKILMAVSSATRGTSKVHPNLKKMATDLRTHPEVIMEGLQQMMRFHGFTDAYERAKTFCRGKSEITLEQIRNEFIAPLESDPRLPTEAFAKMMELTPERYV